MLGFELSPQFRRQPVNNDVPFSSVFISLYSSSYLSLSFSLLLSLKINKKQHKKIRENDWQEIRYKYIYQARILMSHLLCEQFMIQIFLNIAY